MPDLIPVVPYVVPIIAGVLVAWLVVALLLSLAQPGPARAEAMRRAWGTFLWRTFMAAFLLPFLAPMLGVSLNAAPLWLLLGLGVVAGGVYNSALARAGARPGGVRREAQEQRPAPVPGPTPAAQPTDRPGTAEHLATIHRVAVEPAGLDSVAQAIGKRPMPLPRRMQEQPLASQRVEDWYARQDARLGQLLEGKTLAAARLRLSTVKSMLFLGQIGLKEADDDVTMVLRQAGRR